MRHQLSVEAAIDRLRIIDGYVHCFTTPTADFFVGTDWAVTEVKKLFEQNAPELAGPAASAMEHGIACVSPGGTYFFKTKESIE